LSTAEARGALQQQPEAVQQPQRRSLGLRLPPKRAREGASVPAGGSSVAEPPLSPLSHPESYSPLRPEWADVAAVAAPGTSGTGSLSRGGSLREVAAAAPTPTGPTIMDLKTAAARGIGAAAAYGGSTPDLSTRGGVGQPLRPISTPLAHGGSSGALHDLPQGIGRSPSFARSMPPPLSMHSGGGTPYASNGERGTGEIPMPPQSNGMMPRVSSLSSYGSAPSSGAGTPVYSAQAGGLLSSPPYQQQPWAPDGARGQLPSSSGTAVAHGGIWEGWTRPVSLSHPETWELPDDSFELFVTETVQYRIGKYVQPDHPNAIGNDDAHALNRWVTREDLQ